MCLMRLGLVACCSVKLVLQCLQSYVARFEALALLPTLINSSLMGWGACHPYSWLLLLSLHTGSFDPGWSLLCRLMPC